MSEVPQKNVGWAWFWAIVGVLYTISPVDVVPDVLPLGGWADDVVALGTAGLNLLQKYTEDTSQALSSILKVLKYILLFGGIVIVLILVLIALLVYKAVV